MRGIANAMQQADRVAQTAFAQNTTMGFAAREMAAERLQIVPAWILSSVVRVADLKWHYLWDEIRFTESTASTSSKPSSLSYLTAGVALNWNELRNSASLWAPLGNPQNVPPGFKLKPIANNTPVLLFPLRDTTGKVVWVFDKVNAIDGECP